jgi:predicted ester cyclase
MEPQELVDEFVRTFNEGDYDKVMEYLADDFTFSGPVPEPVDAQMWLGLSKALKGGIPDLDFGLHTMGAEGNVINTGTHLKGTHTADLDLTPMGFGIIPATGKSVQLPHEAGKLTVEGDKIQSYEIETTEGGGLMGVLAQIGFQPPSD